MNMCFTNDVIFASIVERDGESGGKRDNERERGGTNEDRTDSGAYARTHTHARTHAHTDAQIQTKHARAHARANTPKHAGAPAARGAPARRRRRRRAFEFCLNSRYRTQSPYHAQGAPARRRRRRRAAAGPSQGTGSAAHTRNHSLTYPRPRPPLTHPPTDTTRTRAHKNALSHTPALIPSIETAATGVRPGRRARAPRSD